MRKLKLFLSGGLLALSTTAIALSFNVSDISLGRNAGFPPATKDVKTADASEYVIPKAPLRSDIAASGLYAYSLLGDNNAPSGMYETSLDGKMTHLWNPAENGYHLRGGWMYNDRYCGLLTHSTNGEFDVVRYQEYNLTTGQVLSTTDLDGRNLMNGFDHCTFIPEDKVIFGMGYDNREWICLKTMSIEDFSDVKVIIDLDYDEYIVAICYNPVDKNIYAMTIKGVVVRIDKETGEYETLYQTPIPPIRSDYNQAMIYLPTADEYLFAACLNDGNYSTIYYRIDLEEMKTIESAKLPNNDFISSLVYTEQRDTEAPLRPTDIKSNFNNGSTTGSISFTLPTTNLGGTGLSGSLSWTVFCDGEKIGEGTGNPGKEASANATLPEGNHIIEVSAAAGNHAGPSAKADIFIGYDTPNAPTNVVLEAGKVSWNAVTTGINGGYINLDDITYEVYIDDQYIGETKDTSIEFEINADAEFQSHSADVKAISGDYESAPGRSNNCLYGAPFALDITFEPTEEEAKIFSSVSDNPSVLSWGLDDWGEMAFSTTIPKADAEAWLVTPPIRIDDPSKVYSLSFESKREMWFSGDDCEITAYLGTSLSAQDMTEVLVNTYTPELSTYTTQEAIFSVPESGTYYIGFRAKVSEQAWRAYIKNIAIKVADISTDGPADCTNLEVTPGAEGKLTATVAFNMPDKNLLGTAYDSETEATALVKCGESTQTIVGKVGTRQSVEFATVQGNNNVSVTCTVDGKIGSTVQTTVYTGIDTPEAPRNFKAVTGEDNLTVKFTWEAPENGANGNWFEPKDITYKIGINKGFYGVTWFDEEYVDTFEATYSISEDDPLNLINFVITATNSVGTSNISGSKVVVGKPYEIPSSDDFSTGYFAMTPVYTEAPGHEYESASLLFQTPVSFNEIMQRYEHSAVGVGTYGEGIQMSRLVFPKFSTKGKEGAIPTVRFDIWTGEHMPSSVTLYGRAYGLDEPVKIGSITPGTDWSEVLFELPEELRDKGWVELYLDSTHEDSDSYVVIYSYGYDWKKGSGVTDIESGEASITVNGHYVYFNGLEGNSFTIHSADGKLVKSGKITDKQTAIALQTGVYVANCGKKTVKVMVR